MGRAARETLMVNSPVYSKAQIAWFGFNKNKPGRQLDGRTSINEYQINGPDSKEWESCYNEVIHYYLLTNSALTGVRAFYKELQEKHGSVTPEWVIFKMIKHGILKEFMLDN